jgi:hypothetical protein
MNGFVKKTTYYTGTVYEWNLPTGSSCPFAKACKVTVDRHTGKMDAKHTEYRCYAAAAERFPGVRDRRWANYDQVRAGIQPVIPKNCESVRIHASGDFFNQDYFDMWLSVARANPQVEFWAYTKSIGYWVARLDSIPSNLVLTASYGGSQDELIELHGLKHARVYTTVDDVPDGVPIDTNDDIARTPGVNFALIDNKNKPKPNNTGDRRRRVEPSSEYLRDPATDGEPGVIFSLENT